MVLVLSIQVHVVLARDERRRFLFNSIVDDARQLFSPDLFALDVEEVLDVLDGALEASELLTKHLEL